MKTIRIIRATSTLNGKQLYTTHTQYDELHGTKGTWVTLAELEPMRYTYTLEEAEKACEKWDNEEQEVAGGSTAYWEHDITTILVLDPVSLA